MTNAYPVGTRLCFKGTTIHGTVVPNTKLRGDVCVQWENGEFSSYDGWFLDENVDIVTKPLTEDL